ncbi:MAG: hypothetical protein GAK35_02213 [Herbaspirillum frisingense]|uniref:Phage tail protein n=1 Tax=Herbaspirillum frisingense TaxID=92645 RepID=A0A7V8FWL0_9BURK|nr:MAG: hypothetical protein GAK35_02213 [Herbaspirillum frisingense]
MAIITKLEVVNACLDTMGESPLNAIDEDHPYVAAALNKLASCNTLEQAPGYWFNSELSTLKPDPNTGYIYIPADAINVDAGDNRIIARGRRLYDRYNGTYDMRTLVSGSVQVFLVREVPFEDLPMLAQHVISARTQLDFQESFDGDSQKYNKLGGAYQRAYVTLKAENIRNQRTNMFNTPSIQQKLRLIQPMSRFARRRW